ncbi:hypothetical protein DYB32_004620 [Aphanomyces invadans]|uniref:C1q domain-containing protein n=1 Tax=Aphanomyces invadans TaxID=157072 RepID=A0A3R6Z4P6_9STRA|nr:hypothetical protein DYB32_004620 [Aphanomyces invadans]
MPPSAGLHGLTHLLAGETEWRNIQTIIKTTLQAVAKVVSNHAVMLETMDARIDRIQDAAMSAQTLPPPRVNNNDDGTAMIVSRKEFLALVADVCKMQKRAVSSDDVEVRVVASGNELKRRLEHTITPLQDALRDMEDMVTKQMEHHMVTRRDLEAVEERVTAASKALHRTQTLQVKDSVGHLEQGLRKHLADHLAAARDELKKFKAQVDESVARTATDCHAHLRQRAMASDVKVVLSDKVDRAELDSREQLEDRVGGRLDDALQQAVAEWKHEVAAALHKKCPKADVAKLLARKVNRGDAHANKVTHTEMQVVLGAAITAVQDEVKQEMQQIQRVLEGKLHDHGEMVAQHVRDLVRRPVYPWWFFMDNASDTIHTKADDGDVQALVDDVTGLRKQLRGELCTGRPTDRHTIAWTVQVVNTNPDVFAWEKGSDHVTAIVPGLYQLQASFFTDYAPTLQVLVNGEPAFVVQGLAVHERSRRVMTTCVRRREKGDALGPHGQRRRRRHTAGNVTGISLCDFLALPPRATVSVTYDIDERAQGFLTLRKL